MTDQTQRLEIATVKAEIGSNIVYRFANDPVSAEGIPTDSGDIKNLNQLSADITADGQAAVVSAVAEGIVDLTGAVDDAASSADRSESAASLAAAASNPYPTIAEGLSATSSSGPANRFFSVPETGSTLMSLYRNDAGSAAKIGGSPSATALLEIREDINSSVGVGSDSANDFMGEDEFMIARFLVDGSLEMMNGKIFNDAKGLGLSDLAGKEIAKFGVSGSEISGLVVEPSTAPGVEIIDDVDFIHPGGDFSGLGEPPSAPPSVASVNLELNQQQVTDFMGVWSYGQSLNEGAYSTPVISTTQLYGNVMIASGNKIRYGDPYYDASAFVPLIETVRDIDGEAPVTAMCNGVSRRIAEDGESLGGVFVAAAPGRGGQSVEALGPGGNGDYEKMLAQIKDHANLAKSLGKTYSVWAYVWIQGEANYSTTGSGATSTKSAYKYTQLQLELFDGLSRELATLGVQKFRPYLFTYQVGAHRKYSSDTMQIALAQWRASRARPDVVLAAPAYIFPVIGDNLHLTNEGSWLQGEYLSRAMKKTMIHRDGKWRPLEPVSVDWASTYVDIKFHVPGGQLVLDNALVAAAPNFGFDIRESGAVVTSLISSVSVTGPDTVRLVLSRPAAADALLSYARGRAGDPTASGPVIGARGNLRDTHGLYDSTTSPLGNTFALHNWCVMFEFNRKTGF